MKSAFYFKKWGTRNDCNSEYDDAKNSFGYIWKVYYLRKDRKYKIIIKAKESFLI